VELLTTGIATYYVTGHTYAFHNRSETELLIATYYITNYTYASHDGSNRSKSIPRNSEQHTL